MYRLRSRHAFAPRRLLALAVIAAVALGLGYLRLAPGPAPLAVPPGAHAGDLTLQPCTYPTEAGDYAADCGTLVVPEHHANPASRLIALPVTRIKATSPNPAEPIFYLEGGPGITNMEFMPASRFAAERDLVLVGYRGVDGSVRLDCPEVTSALSHSTDLLGEKSFRAYGDALRSCAQRLQVTPTTGAYGRSSSRTSGTTSTRAPPSSCSGTLEPTAASRRPRRSPR